VHLDQLRYRLHRLHQILRLQKFQLHHHYLVKVLQKVCYLFHLFLLDQKGTNFLRLQIHRFLHFELKENLVKVIDNLPLFHLLVN
jgi:hypothetical protein